MFERRDAIKWVNSELEKSTEKIVLTGDNERFELCIAGKNSYYVTITNAVDPQIKGYFWIITTPNGFLFTSEPTNGTPAHASIEKAALIQWALNDLSDYLNDLDITVLNQGFQVYKTRAIDEKLSLENLKNEVN